MLMALKSKLLACLVIKFYYYKNGCLDYIVELQSAEAINLTA